MTDSLIEMTHVSKIYRHQSVEIRALVDLNLTVKAGEFLAIMGPSGSGKSTLMNQLGCLDTPTEGRYLFNGVDIAQLSADGLATLRNQSIGFCFQSFNLVSRLTALANVEMPLLYRGIDRQERRERALAVLESVGLGERVNHRPNELSGGQQQRVALARALITEPSLILADEPTGTLDSRTGKEILGLFSSLNEAGITMIVVTHDSDVAAVARRLVILRDGRVSRDIDRDAETDNRESFHHALRSTAS
ncbi:MAG: ABC transporter ATP-binding protein [Hyphomicrobiales bacterium]|nr:ABC transporter ATP-binding protein [Hyphomicrobiales bacterium]